VSDYKLENFDASYSLPQRFIFHFKISPLKGRGLFKKSNRWHIIEKQVTIKNPSHFLFMISTVMIIDFKILHKPSQSYSVIKFRHQHLRALKDERSLSVFTWLLGMIYQYDLVKLQQLCCYYWSYIPKEQKTFKALVKSIPNYRISYFFHFLFISSQ